MLAVVSVRSVSAGGIALSSRCRSECLLRLQLAASSCTYVTCIRVALCHDGDAAAIGAHAVAQWLGLVGVAVILGARGQYGAVLALLASHGVAVTCHVVVCVCTGARSGIGGPGATDHVVQRQCVARWVSILRGRQCATRSLRRRGDVATSLGVARSTSRYSGWLDRRWASLRLHRAVLCG